MTPVMSTASARTAMRIHPVQAPHEGFVVGSELRHPRTSRIAA